MIYFIRQKLSLFIYIFWLVVNFQNSLRVNPAPRVETRGFLPCLPAPVPTVGRQALLEMKPFLMHLVLIHRRLQEILNFSFDLISYPSKDCQSLLKCSNRRGRVFKRPMDSFPLAIPLPSGSGRNFQCRERELFYVCHDLIF